MKIVYVFLIIITIFYPLNVSAELLLFGGSNHDDFIGCYDCSAYNSGSICNEYGTYGSEYSTKSIWNEYGTYGNEYSSKSPWNEYSSSNDVPVIVDRNGNFYGYFTINNYRSNAFNQSSQLQDIFNAVNGDLAKIRDIFCN